MLIMPKRIPEETKQRAVRLVLDHLDEYPNLTSACEAVSKRLGFGGSSDIRWGSWCESTGGEEHAEPVVLAVAEPSREASVEFDDPVDGFGAAVVRAAGGEVRQER